MKNRFSVGDFIEVTPSESNKGTENDFGVIRGTALDDREHIGYADFRIRPNGTDQELDFNLNFVQVRTLFRVTKTG